MRLRRARRKRVSPVCGLAISMMVFLPATTIGLQDPASAIARQSQDNARARQHFIASPFGTIHAATFTLPRPIGSMIPVAGYALAGLDPGDPDITGSVNRGRYYGALNPDPPRVYPTVNRQGKGDRLVPAPEAQPAAFPSGQPSDAAPESSGNGALLRRLPIYDISLSLEMHPQIPLGNEDDFAPERAGGFDVASVTPEELLAEQTRARPMLSALDIPPPVAPAFSELSERETADDTEERTPSFGVAEVTDNIYFDTSPLGAAAERVMPWANGTAPVLESPEANDPDLKKPASAAAVDSIGETVASKGQVTGPGRRPKSPAERLGLSGASRAKAEKCLSEAVYFEARGEAVNGQIAVAQVVMNRVFSGFYPTTVCGVVYQNSHRRLACQFTFACDGIPDRVTEPEAWVRAKKIAKETLDGLLWLKSIGKATHYHAYWVRPNWIREMSKLQKLGVHTFYRPRAWGDGSDAPKWGDPVATKEAEATL